MNGGRVIAILLCGINWPLIRRNGETDTAGFVDAVALQARTPELNRSGRRGDSHLAPASADDG
jgi:hypothetical protein